MALHYEELTAEKMHSKVNGYIGNFAEYFPEYDESYIPPRKYLWDIFFTLNLELAEKLIDHLFKRKTSIK